jgi:hypothetical protein
MWLKTKGHRPHTQDEWVNVDHVVSIRWNARDQHFVLTTVNGLEFQVSEAPALRDIDAMLGSEPHEPSELYG